MPRRTYSRERHRPQPQGGKVFEALLADLQRLRAPAETRDCPVCARPLPLGWKYPEHSRCRPAPGDQHHPRERNQP